jgi:MFS family permease
MLHPEVSALSRARSSIARSFNMNRAFQLLFWEGAFAMVYDTWVGATYLSGLAGELGVSVLCVSLLTSAAWIGGVGQIFGAWAYEHTSSYRRFTLRLAVVSRSLWFLPLLAAAYWTWRRNAHGIPFPVEGWFMLTAGVACLSALFGALSGSAWNSWVRSVVPENKRGRFFGDRSRYVMAALICANLMAAVLVDWRPEGFQAGYAVLGVLGVTAAALSTWLLSRVKDAEPPPKVEPISYLHSLRAALRNRRFRGILIFGAAFNGAMQLGSSYFPYYFTKELRIPMSQVATWIVLANLGCMLAAGRWGKYLDRTRNAARSMRIACLLISISPVFYVSSSLKWVHFIAPLDYFSNGMVWIGFQLAMVTLLFKAIPSERPAFCFSLYSASSSLAGAICCLLGGRLAVWLQPWGGFRALWLITSVCRVLVIWGFFRLVRQSEVKAPVQPARESGELLAELA